MNLNRDPVILGIVHSFKTTVFCMGFNKRVAVNLKSEGSTGFKVSSAKRSPWLKNRFEYEDREPVPWIRVAVETLGGVIMSRRGGDEGATLVTVDLPFRHRINQNQHPKSGCWISLVNI